MTAINLRALQVRLGGLTSTDATVQLQCWAEDGPVVRVSGPDVIVPAIETVRLTAGVPAAPIDYPPTLGTCCVKITVRAGAFSIERFVAIPEVGPVDFDDLVDVDPATFSPSSTSISAWQAWRDAAAGLAAQSTDAAAAARADAVATAADRTATSTAATNANADADRAGTSAFNAAGSAAAAQGSENAAGAARAGAEAARDLALSGQFAGANLGTTDLNTIATPGMYFQPGPASATLARNYPVASGAGVLEVFVLSSTARIQRYVIHGGVAGDVRGEYLRRWAGTVWEPWRFIAGQRVDKTAGIAIYTWDDVAAREQLIYADTGTRDITALVAWPSGVSVTSGSRVLMRRVLWDVTVWIEEGLEASGPVASSVMVMLPAGFVASAQGDTSPIYQRNNLAQIGMVQTLISGQMSIAFSAASGTGANTRFRHVFKTANAWPSTLPGTAVGSISNA